MKKLTILTIAGLFLILCGQLAAQTLQSKSSPYLDDIIQTKMTNAHIPGLLGRMGWPILSWTFRLTPLRCLCLHLFQKQLRLRH